MALTTREARYIHGDQLNVDYTPSSAKVDGEVVVQTDLIGVVLQAIAASALGALCVRGVFDFAKSAGSGTAIVAGDTVYWDDTNNVATATAGSNVAIGKVVTAAADAATVVRVNLNQSGS